MARTPKPTGKKLRDKGKLQGRVAVETRSKRKRFLIVCEGTKTEPNYFRAFHVNADVQVVGAGMSTKSLVESAQRRAKLAADKNDPYDRVWVVFDKDEYSEQDFNQAIEIAHRLGFGTAYSNECFELWYVLHFKRINSALPRSQYIEILTQHLGREYEKNAILYETLLPLQPNALRNAQKLVETYQFHNPAADNPCTTVHLLVEELNRHSH